MREKNFVNFHIITSHSASNLNRDDMGLQKTAIFGGKKRIRISSQCEKQAIRTSDYYKQHIADQSTRSKFVINNMVQRLKENYSDDDSELLVKYGLALAGLLEGKKTPLTKNLSNKNRIETQVIAYSQDEIEKLSDLLSFAMSKKIDIGSSKKSSLMNYFKGELTKIDRNILKNIELDIAFSGRMATCKEYERIDAALAVAQVITTHTASSDIDWFTAVDDLSEDGGAAYLDSQEFGAGVFYKYASLNIKQLQQNLGDCSREKAFEIAAHTLHLLATTTPSGKQNSYAAFNFADFALVIIGHQPISLANAFEVPVKTSREGGYLVPSINKIIEYRIKLFSKYSLDDEWACFNMCEGIKGLQKEKESMNDLKEWLKNGGTNA